MGCCEVREWKPFAAKECTGHSRGQSALAMMNLFQPFTLVFDKHSRELLDYVHSLNDRPQWTRVFSESWLELDTLQHSDYKKDCQVSKVCLTFPDQIDPGLVFDLLNNPDSRLDWDSSLTQMSIEEGDLKSACTMYRVVAGFGIKRDFFEKKCVGSDEGTLVSMAYSTEGKQSNITRALTYFAYLRVVVDKESTHVIMVNQTNVQLPTQTFSKYASVKLKAWCKTFFKQVVKAHSNSLQQD